MQVVLEHAGKLFEKGAGAVVVGVGSVRTSESAQDVAASSSSTSAADDGAEGGGRSRASRSGRAGGSTEAALLELGVSPAPALADWVQTPSEIQ